MRNLLSSILSPLRKLHRFVGNNLYAGRDIMLGIYLSALFCIHPLTALFFMIAFHLEIKSSRSNDTPGFFFLDKLLTTLNNHKTSLKLTAFLLGSIVLMWTTLSQTYFFYNQLWGMILLFASASFICVKIGPTIRHWFYPHLSLDEKAYSCTRALYYHQNNNEHLIQWMNNLPSDFHLMTSTQYGFKALQQAIKIRNYAIVDKLLEKGATVHLSNPLILIIAVNTSIATYDNDMSDQILRIIELLVQKGANINPPNNLYNPLHLALRTNQKKNRTVLCLLDLGADITLLDRKDKQDLFDVITMPSIDTVTERLSYLRSLRDDINKSTQHQQRLIDEYKILLRPRSLKELAAIAVFEYAKMNVEMQSLMKQNLPKELLTYCHQFNISQRNQLICLYEDNLLLSDNEKLKNNIPKRTKK